MRVQVNGESREVADQSTLEDLVRELSLPPARIAIEMNQSVVRRDAWAATNLNDGDRIEIVHFVGGGSSSVMQSVPGFNGLERNRPGCILASDKAHASEDACAPVYYPTCQRRWY